MAHEYLSDQLVTSPDLKPEPKQIPFVNRGWGGLIRTSVTIASLGGFAALGIHSLLNGVDLSDWTKFQIFYENWVAPIGGTDVDTDPVTADAAHPADTHHETPTAKAPEKPATPAPAPTPEHKTPEVKKPEVEVKPDVKPEVHTPKATFASDDAYDLSKLNLTHNGAVPVLLRDPTEDDVWNLEGAADGRGVELSNEEAVQALKNGGFVKDGVTYEIWRDEANQSIFHIVKCDADHMLVGQVPNFDAQPLTHEPRDYNAESDMLNPPVHEEPAVVEETPEEPRGVWFNGQWVSEDSEYQGEGEYYDTYSDRDCFDPSYGTEKEYIEYLQYRYFNNIHDQNFYLVPNPFDQGEISYDQYMAFEQVQRYIVTHP